MMKMPRVLSGLAGLLFAGSLAMAADTAGQGGEAGASAKKAAHEVGRGAEKVVREAGKAVRNTAHTAKKAVKKSGKKTDAAAKKGEVKAGDGSGEKREEAK